jgi:hypothetical protein
MNAIGKLLFFLFKILTVLGSVFRGDPVCLLCFMVATLVGFFRWDRFWYKSAHLIIVTALAFLGILFQVRLEDRTRVTGIYMFMFQKIFLPTWFDARNWRMGMILAMLASLNPLECLLTNNGWHNPSALVMRSALKEDYVRTGTTCVGEGYTQLQSNAPGKEFYLMDYFFSFVFSDDVVPVIFSVIIETSLCMERVITLTCVGYIIGFIVKESGWSRIQGQGTFTEEWDNGFNGQTTMVAWVACKLVVVFVIVAFEVVVPDRAQRLKYFTAGDYTESAEMVLVIIGDPILWHVLYRLLRAAGYIQTFDPINSVIQCSMWVIEFTGKLWHIIRCKSNAYRDEEKRVQKEADEAAKAVQKEADEAAKAAKADQKAVDKAAKAAARAAARAAASGQGVRAFPIVQGYPVAAAAATRSMMHARGPWAPVLSPRRLRCGKERPWAY